MSRSVRTDYEALRERQARNQEPAATTCEAEERITRALFAMEAMTGTWVIDLGTLRAILTGETNNR